MSSSSRLLCTTLLNVKIPGCFIIATTLRHVLLHLAVESTSAFLLTYNNDENILQCVLCQYNYYLLFRWNRKLRIVPSCWPMRPIVRSMLYTWWASRLLTSSRMRNNKVNKHQNTQNATSSRARRHHYSKETHRNRSTLQPTRWTHN